MLRKQSTSNFPKSQHFLPLDTHTCSFSLKHPFWDSPFCLISRFLNNQWKSCALYKLSMQNFLFQMLSTSNKRFVSLILTLQVPIPQNGQTHLNNSSTVADNRLSVLGHSVGSAFKGLILWVANNQKQSPGGVLSKGLFKIFQNFQRNTYIRVSLT